MAGVFVHRLVLGEYLSYLSFVLVVGFVLQRDLACSQLLAFCF